MRLAEIRQFAAEAKKLTSSARPPGPRTEQGKLRSALNATKHGLAGKHLLLPGEDREEYERRMDAVFEALGPTNEAEAQLVALIADDLWKLERLGKIEQGVALGRIEELLGQTTSAEGAGAIANAIAAVAKAITTWETEPIPSERDAEFTRRLGLMSGAISFIDMIGAELPAGVTDVCYPLLARLRGEKNPPAAVPVDAYAELGHEVRVLMALLLEKGERIDALQENLRKAIATVALPDDTELKKLARYRKLLEDGLQRRLASLDQLRKLVVAPARTEDDKLAARGYRVKLRVVT